MEIWIESEKKLILQLELFESDTDNAIRVFYCHKRSNNPEKWGMNKKKKNKNNSGCFQNGKDH